MSWLIYIPGANLPLRVRFCSRAEAYDYASARYPYLVWELVWSMDYRPTHVFVDNELIRYPL